MDSCQVYHGEIKHVSYHEFPSSVDEDEVVEKTCLCPSELDKQLEKFREEARRVLKPYTIFTEEEIRQLQDQDISELSSLLCVSRGLACTMLLQSKWQLRDLAETWFADEEGVHELPEQESLNLVDHSYFKICSQATKIENNMLSALCGRHPFCSDCLRDYISASINNDGPGCLRLGCPETGCEAKVGIDMVDLLASDYDKDKYYRYLLQSYIEGNSFDLKQCPGPGCHLFVRLNNPIFCNTYDVTCACSYRFCWRCLKDYHHPMECQIIDEWCKLNNTPESKSIAHLVSSSFTQLCPKCNKIMEKKQGCNHVTCASPACGFEFCWLCLGPWTKDTHICNKYEGDHGKDSLEPFKKYWELYAHCYERWDANHKSRDVALANLNWARNDSIDRRFKYSIQRALEQIVEWRNELKWSYAYGYFSTVTKSDKVEFFWYLQGQAEAALESLHHCAEKAIGKHLNGKLTEDDVATFRSNLACLSRVTKAYFESLNASLVRGLLSSSCRATISSASAEVPRAHHQNIH